MAAQAKYEFGDFRLDPSRRRLERTEGAEVALGAKAFDALVHLIEHAGEPVSRRALTAVLERLPLNSSLEAREGTRLWIRGRITFDTTD